MEEETEEAYVQISECGWIIFKALMPLLTPEQYIRVCEMIESETGVITCKQMDTIFLVAIQD